MSKKAPILLLSLLLCMVYLADAIKEGYCISPVIIWEETGCLFSRLGKHGLTQRHATENNSQNCHKSIGTLFRRSSYGTQTPCLRCYLRHITEQKGFLWAYLPFLRGIKFTEEKMFVFYSFLNNHGMCPL